MNRFRRSAASLVTADLRVVGAVAATAPTAGAGTIGSHGVASGTANHPLTITVTLTSSPDESVTVSWDTVCSQENSEAGVSSGSRAATTPVTRVITHPYHQPDSCDVAADAGLNDTGISIEVSIASSTAPPLPVHAIKRYDGKYADDTAGGSDKSPKIELWSCDKTAAKNWSFGNGEFRHNDECANDAHSSAANDDPGYSGENGPQLVVYTRKESASQHRSLP